MKLFGTDGIRGPANVHPMDAPMAVQIGMASAVYLNTRMKTKTNRVIIGKDTRLSGYMFEYALVAGLTSMGMNVILLGPMPTPAIAMLTASMRADLGIMISASHNPFYDNGIKLFNNQGYKLSSSDEKIIEDLINSDLSKYLVKPGEIGMVDRLNEASGRYIQYLKSMLPREANFRGLKIVIDSANGAAYKIAPFVFYELGAEVISIGANPNGMNINKDCGSTHLDEVRAKVLEEGANLGLAYDGDADRLIAIDDKGNIINGDKILSVIAVHMKNQNKLYEDTVVSTVMANISFIKYLEQNGIKVLQTQVGDKYVSKELQKNKLSLGGEQSGHIIMSKYSTTGDGILASLKLVQILVEANEPSNVVLNSYKEAPQILKNITFINQNPLEYQVVKDFISKCQEKYKDKYRILVRKSGTEKLIRVMVEGENKTKIGEISKEITDFISKTIKI